jgi:hypothetical protein
MMMCPWVLRLRGWSEIDGATETSRRISAGRFRIEDWKFYAIYIEHMFYINSASFLMGKLSLNRIA